MRLFDQFYIIKRSYDSIEESNPTVIDEQQFPIKKSEIDEFMMQHVKVYREDGILSNLWRWVKCGF